MIPQIIKQPNNKYAVFDLQSRTFALINLSKEELIQEYIDYHKKLIHETIDRILNEIDQKIPSYGSSTISYEQAIASHALHRKPNLNDPGEREFDQLVQKEIAEFQKDFPDNWTALTKAYPKLLASFDIPINTKVLTKNLNNSNNWSTEALATRKENSPGIINAIQRGKGICYEVKHDDGTISWYDPEELQIQ